MTRMIRPAAGTGRFRAVRDDDSGALAIVVAVSMSTVILGCAALAVDLGAAYARGAQVQGVAESLVLAGAAGLPAVDDPDPADAVDTGALGLVQASLDATCRTREIPGLCDAPAGWATNDDPADGEITFYQDGDGDDAFDDRTGDGVADALTLGAARAGGATGIRVTLPASTVEFGAAKAFGADSVDVQRSASARIGTPLGLGVLPFAVTPQVADGGRFCIRDPAVTDRPPVSQPGPQSPFVSVTLAPATLEAEAQERTVEVRVALPPNVRVAVRDLRIHFGNSATDVPITSGPVTQLPAAVEVEAPPGDPGSVQVWATGTATVLGTQVQFTSQTATLTYTPSPSVGEDPCAAADATLGALKLPRSDAPAGPQTVARNVRVGPEVNLFPAGLLGTLTGTTQCLAGQVGAAADCLLTESGPFSAALRDGLLAADDDTPGRMLRDCGAEPTTAGGVGGVDGSRLFAAGSPLVDEAALGPGLTPAELREQLDEGDTDDVPAGWVRSAALRCPRLAVLPVVTPTVPGAGVLGANRVTGFTYAWIDGAGGQRGLTFRGGVLQSVSGYVVKPEYLPGLVAGSPVVGSFMGAGMPKEALVIRDIGGAVP